MEKFRVLRDQRGFTLIELAIVLVIIGIILGAVLKGQDLITSARSKKFVNDAGRKWEVGAWTHFDRKGRFPGDADSDGIIGEAGTENVQADIAALSLTQPPVSPVTFGSFQFYVFLGSDDVTAGANQQNTLVICRASDCASAYTADEIAFVESFDTAIDGLSDGTAGLVRGVNAAPDTLSAANYLATFNADLAAGAAWTAGTTQALVYFFDRQAN